MTKVHPTAFAFFDAKMREHARVQSYAPIGDPDQSVFRVTRKGGLPDVIVFYSDAYRFGRLDFINRPAAAHGNLFVLILPHGDYDDVAARTAKAGGANIGMLSDLMGALNVERVHEYRTQRERVAEQNG